MVLSVTFKRVVVVGFVLIVVREWSATILLLMPSAVNRDLVKMDLAFIPTLRIIPLVMLARFVTVVYAWWASARLVVIMVIVLTSLVMLLVINLVIVLPIILANTTPKQMLLLVVVVEFVLTACALRVNALTVVRAQNSLVMLFVINLVIVLLSIIFANITLRVRVLLVVMERSALVVGVSWVNVPPTVCVINILGVVLSAIKLVIVVRTILADTILKQKEHTVTLEKFALVACALRVNVLPTVCVINILGVVLSVIKLVIVVRIILADTMRSQIVLIVVLDRSAIVARA